MSGRRTHGASRTPAYRAWTAMLSRCRLTTSHAYEHYGARGITVCDRWLDYANFLADMGPRPPGMTLERRENDKGYNPDNCEWATRAQQSRNTRANHYLTANGKRQLLTDWAQDLGTSVSTLLQRLNKLGWSEERVCLTPVKKYIRTRK